jgi:cystathionine beta-lyase/cystathionine gamma-synthase
LPAPQAGKPVPTVLDLASTYSFDDSTEFAKASADKVGGGYVYSRWANPTVDAFESAVADLEGAEDAEAFSSGMAAISSVFLGLCRSGDRIAAVRQLYGGTYSILASTLPRYGIETTFADMDDIPALEAAASGAKLLHCETIGNPRIQVADLERLGAIAEAAGIPLVVDNTFASPILCRPLEYGATISLHSVTKFIGGHHDLVGGIVCSDGATLARIQELTRETGPTMAPLNAWLSLRGLQTLPLRVERACDNALALARFLEASPHVNAVFYPGLESDPSHELATKLLGGRGGGTIGFDVVGGRDRAERFQNELELVLAAASLGGTHSLIVHAASITHTQLSAEELEAAGISEGFCRMSVGVEDAEDLIDDLAQAFEASA